MSHGEARVVPYEPELHFRHQRLSQRVGTLSPGRSTETNLLDSDG
jgi:hypothetical protein